MRLHDKLGRLLQSGAVEGEGGGKVPQPPSCRYWLRCWLQGLRFVRVVLVLLGFFVATLGDVALAVVADDTEQMHLLSGEDTVVWRPPNSAELVLNAAQWGSPVAPFVFDGGVLHVGASFAATREFRVRQRAWINVHNDAAFTVSGKITSDSSFAQGFAKLGAGTLHLAGANDFRGLSMLLQGGLHLATSQALGQGYNTLQVNTGTRLGYAAGITVGNNLQFQNIDVAAYAPAGSYTPVAAGDYADSVQWFVDGGTATQAGSLSGWVPIVKQGAGTLRFNGSAMAYDGLFTVNQGALAMDGYYWGPVQVNTGAQLQGIGQVGSTTVGSGGVLAPGNGLPAGLESGLGTGTGAGTGTGTGIGASAAPVGSGQLTVQGNVQFHPGAGFQVHVAPSGWNTSLRVTGKALLDGNVMALAQAGDWQETTRYTIVHAEDGFDGTQFASVNTDLAFLSPSLEYDAQKVYLVLARNGTGFEDIADDADKDVADAIDDPTDVPDIHDKIVSMTEPQARDAFKQLSGNWYGSVQTSIVGDSRFLREAVWANAHGHGHWHAPGSVSVPGPGRGILHAADVGRNRSVGSNPSTGRSLSEGGSESWGYGYFSSAHRASAQGVDGDSRNLGGAVMGVSWPTGGGANSGEALGRGMRASAFFGTQQSRLQRDANMGSAGIRSLQAGLGLAGQWRNALWALGAAYSWHRVHSTRKVAVQRLRDSLSADFNAYTAQVFGQMQWPFVVPVNRRFGRGAGQYTLASLTISPFVRATGLQLRTNGFTEDGGSAVLAVAGSSASAVFSTVGIKVEQDIRAARGDVTLGASLAWRHAAGSDVSQTRQHFRDSVRGKAFVAEGLSLASNVLQLQLGLRARVGKAVKLGLSYAGQFASGVRDHGARLNVSWAF